MQAFRSLLKFDLCRNCITYAMKVLNQQFLTFWLLRTPTESLLEAADPYVISTIWASKQYTNNTQETNKQITKYFI
jgi:hypothetical protein